MNWNAVAKIGIPGTIAIFLVYRLAFGLDAVSADLHAVTSDHRQMQVALEQTRDLVNKEYGVNDKVFHVLQVMCVNNAKTNDERRLCLVE